MGSIGYAMGGIAFIVFLSFTFIGLGLHNAQTNQNIDCPYTQESIREGLSGNSTNIFIQFSTTFVVLASPCAGIPWWIYIIFALIIIGVAVWLTPLVGG